MNRILVYAAFTATLLFAGCMWLDYKDSLGGEQTLDIPDGWRCYRVTLGNGETVLLLCDPQGRSHYYGEDGKLKQVPGGGK